MFNQNKLYLHTLSKTNKIWLTLKENIRCRTRLSKMSLRNVDKTELLYKLANNYKICFSKPPEKIW